MGGEEEQAHPGRMLAVGTIVLTLVGWSSIPLFLRHFASLLDPWTVNGWRYTMSALLWLPVILLACARGRMPARLWRDALWPSVFNAAGQVLFAYAPYLVGAGLMAFGLRVQIVFVALGAAMLFPLERKLLRHKPFVVAMGVVFAGTLATVALTPRGGESGDRPVLGTAVSIGAGFFYALYSLSVRKRLGGYPALLSFAAVSQLTAIPVLALMLVLGKDHGRTAVSLGGTPMVMLVLSAVVGIGIGHTLYFFSLKRLGVAVSAGVVQMQPILVSIASVPLFGERLTGAQMACGAVAIGGALGMLVVQERFARGLRRGGASSPAGGGHPNAARTGADVERVGGTAAERGANRGPVSSTG